MFDINLYCKKKYEVIYLFDVPDSNNISNNTIRCLQYSNDSNDNILICKDPDTNLYKLRPLDKNLDKDYYKFATHGVNIICSSIYDLYKRYNTVKILPINTNKVEVVLPNNSNKTVIKLDFDGANRIIQDTEYNILMNYSNNYIEDRLIETFWFNDHGYYYENKYEDDYLAEINNTKEVNFLLSEYHDIFNIDILTKLPNIISYSDGLEYKIFYDKYGLVKDIVCNGLSYDITKYQLENRDGNETMISLHPLLYDAFDYSYIDDHMKYWAIDVILIDTYGEDYSFKRTVYEIKGLDELTKLLQFINTTESMI